MAPEIVFVCRGSLKRSRFPVLAPGHGAAPLDTDFLSIHLHFLSAAFILMLALPFWFLLSLFTFSFYPFPPDPALSIM